MFSRDVINRCRISLAVACLAMLVSACNFFRSAPDPQAQETVSAFYQTYLGLRPSGVPSTEDLQKFQPYISVELGGLLKQAANAEQVYYKATKGEVPPLVEGDLFTSLFEGASNFDILSCENKEATGSCSVQFTYIDPSDRSSHQWKDKAFVVKEPGGWRVDDIGYGGDWEFMHKGRMRDVLKQVIKDGNSKQN